MGCVKAKSYNVGVASKGNGIRYGNGKVGIKFTNDHPNCWATV